MPADPTATAAPRRFEPLSWAIGFATGLILGSAQVALAVMWVLR